MAQCAAKTKKGKQCENPTVKGSKFCHIHRRRRRLLSVSAIVAIIGLIASAAGILDYIGIHPSLTNTIRAVKGVVGITIPVSDSNAIDVVYRMVENQIQLGFDCPEDLDTPEWAEFKTWLNKLDFGDLSSPEKDDLENFRSRFSRLLDKPPSPVSDTAKFDCGVAEGELLLELRPVLVDYELSEEKASSDGKHLGIVRGIRDFISTLRLQYLLLLGVDPNRLENVRPEARSFSEHLVIWMVLYFDPQRTSTVIMAQGAFLALNEKDLYKLTNRDDFLDIHKNLALMSQAMTRDDKVEVGSYGARVLAGLSRISQSAISEDEASYIGGERFVQIVTAMSQYERGRGNEADRLEQVVNMMRTMVPKDK